MYFTAMIVCKIAKGQEQLEVEERAELITQNLSQF